MSSFLLFFNIIWLPGGCIFKSIFSILVIRYSLLYFFICCHHKWSCKYNVEMSCYYLFCSKSNFIDWLIECCLISSSKNFMHIHDKSILMDDDDDEWTLLCTILQAETDFNMLAHKSNSSQEDVPLYPITLFWLWVNQSLLLLLNAACLAEKQHIPILMSLV